MENGDKSRRDEVNLNHLHQNGVEETKGVENSTRRVRFECGFEFGFNKEKEKDPERVFEEDEGVEEDEDEDVQTTPFNLKEEREEGFFDDESGSYVLRSERKSDKEERDDWVDGDVEQVSRENEWEWGRKRAETAAALARKKATAELKQKKREETSSESLYAAAAGLLRPGETVMRGLQRLAKEAVKHDFDTLTELADELLDRGDVDVFRASREALEGKAGSGLSGGADRFDFEIEYIGNDGNIHGPFPRAQVKEWVDSGFFSGPENRVKMRKCHHRKSESPVPKRRRTNDEKTATAAAAELEADFEDDDESEGDLAWVNVEDLFSIPP